MKKTLFTAALAFVLSAGGVALYAQNAAGPQPITLKKDYSLVKLVVESKVDANLGESLTVSDGENTSTFGYVNSDGAFVSLAEDVAKAQAATGDKKSASYVLGKFNAGETFQFGYGNESNGLVVALPTSLKVASDAGYYAEYNIESFYNQDFSQDPFDGMIDIFIMPEPLPSSTVSMLIALAAAGAFLLYRNRKTRAHFSAQA